MQTQLMSVCSLAGAEMKPSCTGEARADDAENNIRYRQNKSQQTRVNVALRYICAKLT